MQKVIEKVTVVLLLASVACKYKNNPFVNIANDLNVERVLSFAIVKKVTLVGGTALKGNCCPINKTNTTRETFADNFFAGTMQASCFWRRPRQVSVLEG